MLEEESTLFQWLPLLQQAAKMAKTVTDTGIELRDFFTKRGKLVSVPSYNSDGSF